MKRKVYVFEVLMGIYRTIEIKSASSEREAWYLVEKQFGDVAENILLKCIR
jgi:hypothetical protein